MQRDKLIEDWFNGSQALQRAWKARFYVQMGDQKLTVGQVMMLFYLAEKHPVSSKQIASDMQNSKSAVAQLLDSLDEMQLITRHHDPSDRRIMYVSLSKAGSDSVKSLQERRRAFFDEVAQALTDDELAAVALAQQKMIKLLQERKEEANAKNEQL
jgi:DNA-binding MarR family transcriptional regulator